MGATALAENKITSYEERIKNRKKMPSETSDCKEEKCCGGEECHEEQYQNGGMQRSVIIDRLRQEGCRITRQRKIILDIILEEDCTCCKEIYFMAAKRDPNIGMATIYRMINLLEKIGALKRKRAYHIYGDDKIHNSCRVQFSDRTSMKLDGEMLRQVIEKGMESCGYLNDRTISCVALAECD